MRRHTGWAVVSALLAASACIEDFGPLELHPDVVWLEILLVAGESEARMLAIHPHREPEDGAPEVDARLRGPGWEAAFSETLELKACTGAGPSASVDGHPAPLSWPEEGETLTTRVRYRAGPDIGGLSV